MVPEKREKASVEKKKDEKSFFWPQFDVSWSTLSLKESYEVEESLARFDADRVWSENYSNGRFWSGWNEQLYNIRPSWISASLAFQRQLYLRVRDCQKLFAAAAAFSTSFVSFENILETQKINERFWKPLIENDFSSEAVASEKLLKMDSGKVVMN